MRCRIPPAGGLGVSPRFLKSPKTGGFRGLKKDSTRDGAVEARRAHNPKAVGSNPTPATNETKKQDVSSGHCPAFLFAQLGWTPAPPPTPNHTNRGSGKPIVIGVS